MPLKADDAAEIDRQVMEIAGTAISHTMALAYTSLKVKDRAHFSILGIAESLSDGVRREPKVAESFEGEILVVDRDLFESDVSDSALLEVTAARLLLPNRILMGGDYLYRWDKRYRRRKVEESLTSLVLEHPELSSELLIDPRYFSHDILPRLFYIFPQGCDFLRNLDEKGDSLVEGYSEVLGDLEAEGIIHFAEGLASIDRGFIDSVLGRGISASEQLSRVQRQINGLLKLGIGGLSSLIAPLPGQFLVGGFANLLKESDAPGPDRFLYFPTARGPTPISGSKEIAEMIRELDSSAEAVDIRVCRIGSLVNDVYLLTYGDESEKRVVMKRYPTWSNLKWAPLAIWTLGTQNFAVIGRSRMERECSTTSFLIRNGIRVPTILHTSFKNRTLMKEYIEGVTMDEVVKAAIQRGSLDERETSLFQRVGGIVAAVHLAGGTLGDCKPENLVLTSEDEIYVIDLEQGARGGNKAWDVAEFLYFSGHYAGPLDPPSRIAQVARSFIKGYIEEGGSVALVNEAANFGYTKVFAPFTLPQVLYAVSKVCREA